MVLALCIGDFHVPMRAADVPAKFKQLLVAGKIQHILCTGDLCIKEMHDYLKGICSDLHIVKGEFDESNYPETKVLTVGSFKIGICHGHQVIPWGDIESLAMLQRQLDVDILVSGHVTSQVAGEKDKERKQCKVLKYEDRLLVNPGSATGAYNGITHDVKPSFVLLDIAELKVDAYVYELVDGDVKVEKVDEFVRKQ